MRLRNAGFPGATPQGRRRARAARRSRTARRSTKSSIGTRNDSPLLLPHSPNFHLAPRSLSSHQLSPPHCTGKHTRSGAGAESPTRPQPTALPSGRFTLATKEDSELLLMTSPTRLSLRQHGPAPKHLLRPSATSLGCTASVRCRAER